ncbi:MAG: creatininase family protein [Roseovarius sp.]|nr:creatininase family protein [Roseovarius sp.]
MKWPEIEDYLESESIALIPIGATEQHGFHLPLMVDTCWATTLAEEAAMEAGVVVAPPVHFGWSVHHMSYPGGITLRPETLTAVCLDIGMSLVHHGFSKIIYINGNRNANLPPMEIAANQLRLKTGAKVAIADVGLLAKHEIRDICESEPGGLGHAGESETALMLARHPDLVDMSKAVKVIPHRKQFAGNVIIDPLTDGPSISEPNLPDAFLKASEPTGVMGDALLATKEKGDLIIAALVRNLVKYIDQIRPQDVDLHERPLPV